MKGPRCVDSVDVPEAAFALEARLSAADAQAAHASREAFGRVARRAWHHEVGRAGAAHGAGTGRLPHLPAAAGRGRGVQALRAAVASAAAHFEAQRGPEMIKKR